MTTLLPRMTYRVEEGRDGLRSHALAVPRHLLRLEPRPPRFFEYRRRTTKTKRGRRAATSVSSFEVKVTMPFKLSPKNPFLQ